MANHTIRSCARGVLCIDTPDDPSPGLTPVPEPSADLLDRARVGWERFIGADEEPADA
ncbi:hypothetical protein ACGFYU_20915 [Streptomyces sp. NPDC048337]|uniref:hypothetical protein n=1 Tax=Streptomyces sp. NPDC048337 TaxID=3365535 RepID=UPI00370FF235